MINWIENIDQSILLLINGAHHPFFDFLFWNLSKTICLVPLFLITFYFVYQDQKLKKALIILGYILVTLALTDIISTQVFKEGIKRYRPSHHAIIGPQLHLHEESPGVFYKGGQYGFFSSHAANIAGFISFIFPWFWQNRRKWLYILCFMGVLVCYSRIYLGVHYPSDILAGVLFGAIIGLGMHRLFRLKYKE